jgi:hypothetical protein
MPVSGDDMEVHAQRKGDGAYVLFVSQENLSVDMDSSPVICKVEYYEGCAMFGIPEAPTTRMFFSAFHVLADGWRLVPSPCFRRDVHGWVIHEPLTYWKTEKDLPVMTRSSASNTAFSKVQPEAQRLTCARINSES